ARETHKTGGQDVLSCCTRKKLPAGAKAPRARCDSTTTTRSTSVARTILAHPASLLTDNLTATAQCVTIAPQTGHDNRQQTVGSVLFKMLKQLVAHARIPKALHVAGNIVGAGFEVSGRLE